MTCGSRKALLATVLLAALPAPGGVLAAESAAPPGAISCAGCHAAGGTPGPVPGITGRPVDEIVTAMAAFRDGTRPATVMDRIAKGFTADETEAIARWLMEAE